MAHFICESRIALSWERHDYTRLIFPYFNFGRNVVPLIRVLCICPCKFQSNYKSNRGVRGFCYCNCCCSSCHCCR
nr:MAG TPA: hypothetical protein [Caudoviricetes sp.]